MPEISTNNKRIAKNTLLLYFRMLFLMLISLYTSRVILNALGVVDYGIYNVVGGVISMIGLINGTMTVSTQRFLNYAMGKKDILLLNKYFSICFVIFFLIGILFFIFSETFGIWFVNSKLAIPEDRLVAVNWVFQFSVFITVISLLSNPFSSTIIAHERMSIYAYISIIDAIIKLIIAYMIYATPFDKLITYSFLLLISTLLHASLYIGYCLKKFIECRIILVRERKLYMEVLSFSSWNLFGTMSSFAKGQGLNILLNLFFTPAVNAARGIAYQVNNALSHFFTNFYMAVRPQITKSYAAKDFDVFFKLIFRSSRYSFYLILIFSLPLIVETPFVIQVWLGQLPDYVVPFFRLIIIITALDAIVAPLNTASSATGRVKFYQFIIGTLNIANLPVSYFFLKNGCQPIVVFQVSLFIAFINLFIRTFIIKYLIRNFPLFDYYRNVYLVMLKVTILSFVIPLILYYNLDRTTIYSIIICFTSLFSTIIVIYLFGLSHNEKSIIKINLSKVLHRYARIK